MTFTKELTADQEAIMQAVVGTSGEPTIEELLNGAVDTYIKTCAVNVGLDLDAQVQKKLEGFTDDEKKALLSMDLKTAVSAAVTSEARAQ
jgi:hypothetical protein